MSALRRTSLGVGYPNPNQRPTANRRPITAPHRPSYLRRCPLQPLTAPYTASHRSLGASLSGGAFLCFDDEECAALSAEDLAAAFSPASRSAALACLCFYRLREAGE